MRFHRCRTGAFILFFVVLTVFSGCASQAETPSLWVVTEQSDWDGMNWQAEMLIDQYQQMHPEITVELELLPKEEGARTDRINRLRYLIAAGDGPDVFLMPTNTTTHGSDWRSWNLELKLREMKPLFKNVELTMYNGMFADLSAYYDADTDLKTEELNRQIMDAGTIRDGSFRDGRYILPLRYDFPVLYADTQSLPNFGLTLDDLGDNILQLLDAAINSGDERLACSAEPFWLKTQRSFSLLGNICDYQNGTVSLTKEEVAALLQKIQAAEAMVADAQDHRRPFNFGNFSILYYDVLHNGDISGFTDKRMLEGWVVGFQESKRFPSRLPMRVGTTQEAIMLKAVAKSNDRSYAMIPLRGTDGGLTAYVTWYGAVSAGSGHIAEAYDLLRLFLTEDAQYEVGRPFRKPLLPVAVAAKPRWTTLMEEGWPVRMENGAGRLWHVLRTSIQGVGSGANYHGSNGYYFPNYPSLEKFPVPQWVQDLPLSARAIIETQLTDEDLAPLLDASFDRVYFGNALEQDFSRMIRSLNDLATGEPTDADVNAMAAKLLEQLKYQVMEG